MSILLHALFTVPRGCFVSLPVVAAVEKTTAWLDAGPLDLMLRWRSKWRHQCLARVQPAAVGPFGSLRREP